MARVIDDSAVEPVVRALLGAIDVDGGATEEQRAVLGAIVAGYWERLDLSLDALEPLDPEGAAAAIPGEAQRARVRELMVLLELCRHPLGEAQVRRVDHYAAALGESGPGLVIARALVREGAEAAMADYFRCMSESAREMAEPTLRDTYLATLAAPDRELASRLRALHDLPDDTLGYAYVEFYRRNGITLPGEDPSMPAMFVAHDMCHVIGGYEPTGPGEIALGGMLLALADTPGHWIGFLGNLAVHEAGVVTNESVTGKTATLTREGAPEMLARAMWRGARCTGDFTTVDHLALAHLPLEEVRARFGVPPVAARST
jgi:hypothetical protein